MWATAEAGVRFRISMQWRGLEGPVAPPRKSDFGPKAPNLWRSERPLYFWQDCPGW